MDVNYLAVTSDVKYIPRGRRYLQATRRKGAQQREATELIAGDERRSMAVGKAHTVEVSVGDVGPQVWCAPQCSLAVHIVRKLEAGLFLVIAAAGYAPQRFTTLK